mgnify:CR=1 FL=1
MKVKRGFLTFLLVVQAIFTSLTVLHLGAEIAFDRKRPILASMLYPWDYRYPFNVGAAHLILGNYEAAEAYYLRTLENFPTFLEAKNNLATVWAMTGREEQAEKLWHEILDADPKYESAKLNLRMIEAPKRALKEPLRTPQVDSEVP